MENNKVLETQLLAHAMQEPSVAKQVLSRNYTSLLSDEKDKNIAKVLIKYYNGSSVPISEDLLRSHISKMLSDTNRINARKGQPELTTDDENDYYSRALDIYNSVPDRSDTMMHDIDKYIHDKLTATAFIEESALGEDDIGNRAVKRMTEINNISIRGVSNKPIDVYDDMEAREKIYSEEYTNNKVPFGLKPLDDVTRGGLDRKEIMLIAAPSGKGKTTVMSNLSYYFSFVANQNVLHISLEELPSTQLVRFDRLAGNAGVNDIYTEDGEIKPQFVTKMNKWLTKQKGKHGMLRYISSTPNTMTVDDIRQQVISTERETGKKISVLVLDYADLLKKSSSSVANEAQIGEILYQDLSKLAHELDLVLITGTQLNRSSGDQDVKNMGSIEGSYRKINIVSLALTVNSNKQEFEKGYMRFYIDKARSRFGYPDNFIYLKYNLKNMLLVEETPQELSEHRSLAGSDSSKNVDVKKSSKEQTMDSAITDSINDTLAKAFS